MKNIFLLSAEKSRLYIHQGKLYDNSRTMHIPDGTQIPQHIYITSDSMIETGSWYLDTTVNVIFKNDKLFLNGIGYTKIILTTDPTLIADGVQAIDDEFLKWFVKNPTCEYAHIGFIAHNDIREYKIIIPQEEAKQETLEDYIERETESIIEPEIRTTAQIFLRYGANWQAERMYSEEEVNEIISAAWLSCEDNEGETFTEVRKRILEKFKKK
jgi:hypothetical protein